MTYNEEGAAVKPSLMTFNDLDWVVDGVSFMKASDCSCGTETTPGNGDSRGYGLSTIKANTPTSSFKLGRGGSAH